MMIMIKFAISEGVNDDYVWDYDGVREDHLEI